MRQQVYIRQHFRRGDARAAAIKTSSVNFVLPTTIGTMIMTHAAIVSSHPD
jgi:hypothetical protein